MATREELEIMLRDSITPGLRAIARELRELNQTAKDTGSTQVAGNVDNLARSFRGLSESTNSALRGLTAVGNYVLGFSKAVLGVGGAAEGIERLTEGLKEFAYSTVQMSNFAKDTKFTTENISSMQYAMQAMGKSTQEANSYIGAFASRLDDLETYRQDSTFFKQLEAMPGRGAQFASGLLEQMDKGASRETLKNQILDFYESVRTPAKNYLQQIFGVPASVFKDLREYQNIVGATFDINAQSARKFVINNTVLTKYMEEEWKRFADHALIDINRVGDSLVKGVKDQHGFSEFLKQGWNELTVILQQDKKDLLDLIELVKNVTKTVTEAKEFVKESFEKTPGEITKGLGERPAEGTDSFPFLKKFFPDPESAGQRLQGSFAALEEMKIQQENTRLLESIRDTLQKMEEKKGGGVGYAGSAAGPYTGSRSGSVPSTGGGGVAPYPEEFKFPAPGTAPAAIRYNNPGAQYPSEEAKRFGMTGAGQIGGGHLIAGFPTPEQGLASNMDLLSRKYVGMTISDAIRKWSGGSRSSVPGFRGDEVITPEMAKDPNFMLPFFRQMQRAEAGKEWLTEEQMKRGYDIYRSGGTKAFRDRMDEAAARRDAAAKGSANVTVDFGKQQSDAKGTADAALTGGPFKEIKIGREPQSAKAGDPADFNSRWYFQ
jgi:hypothetical protein